ncbi:trypsin inhibitor-like [Episyrphus balteatus]|uniref:trypsin inhibitor-like n=1 Tax=Episyrphus balteatus TaxID=286459 RepID=UPI002484F284|nr:trypsin inhibitor-like [Episyrphus balteatus]
MKIIFGLMIAVLSLFALIAAEKPAACLQRHSSNGDDDTECRGLFRMWSYNAAEDKCVKFIYGGCDGNDNQFKTKEACEATCRKP